MNSINGYSYGKISIGDQQLLLPLTNKGGGLEEILVLRQIRKEGIGADPDAPSIVQKQRAQGFDIIWNFHYEDFITGEALYNKFYPVLKAWKAGSEMILTPRIDLPTRYFRVILTNETLTLKLAKATQKNKFHKGVLFTFQTVEMQSDPGWLPTPEPLPVYDGGGSVFTPIEGSN